jgi:hypothetical protein
MISKNIHLFVKALNFQRKSVSRYSTLPLISFLGIPEFFMITWLRDIKAIVSQGFFQVFSKFSILKLIWFYLVFMFYSSFKTKNELFSPFSGQGIIFSI